MKRSWFDRTFHAGVVAAALKGLEDVPTAELRRRAEEIKSELVECNGKCRKGAIDPECRLHGVWRLP